MFNIQGSYSKSKSKSNTTIKRVPSILKDEEVRPQALATRDLALKAATRTPGISPENQTLFKTQAADTIAGSKRGAQQGIKNRSAMMGWQGGIAELAMKGIEQAAMREQRLANVQLSLAEQNAEMSDMVKQAAIATNFLFGNERSRGAGQAQRITSDTSGSKWGISGGWGGS